MNCEFEPNQSWETLASTARYRPAELASLCAVSLRTLQRHFRKQHGATVSEWLRDVRLVEAYRLLIGGNTVKQASLMLGYKQLSHFSRDFKDYFGVAPRFLSTRRGRGMIPSPEIGGQPGQIQSTVPLQIASEQAVVANG